ncbi:hypothetical protein [Streptomyces hainanensis]|uniref:Uncharacterized protein n=1 Tax=Streptomyces hainanensis TaxID=402648 RepID=A0A4R4SN77_9ACTN|nr:hypothetical protein [Streptomyces hainanensis]TDC63103.1 hypothetical protein E1283_32950 [Streptomyces hainanensis]
MPKLDFTRDEVEGKAGEKKPWTRQREFSEEIDPEDMADTAAIYARAAGEAENSGELAEEASRLGAESGGLDGATLVDDEGRIDETARGLQGNGADMDEVVTRLVQAMNRAIDAESDVQDEIHGTNGLEKKYTDHLQDAVDEWNGWQSALEGAVTEANNSGAVSGTVAVRVTHNGKTINADQAESGGGYVYSLPDSLASEIREKHLDRAVDSAEASYDEISDHIDAYRQRLMEYGSELQGLGYDLAGPLGLWTTEGQAEYAADKLSEELAKDDPDRRLLAMYTQGLSGIADAIFGDSANPGDPLRDLTAAERAYLDTFFSGVDAEALASLGNTISGWDEAKRNIANGLTMLTDPELGGHDPTTEAGRAALPEVVRRFVYDYENGRMWPGESGTTDADGFREELQLFNGFGDIMSHGTLQPGDAIAKDMANAALDIQARSGVQQALGIYGDEQVANTGSSRLLTTVSRNTEASAALLNDADFRDEFLGQWWQDSFGAADLIRAGTSIPEGVGHNDPEARQYVEAAFNLLADAPDNGRHILGQGGPQDGPMGLDHAALQRAISDTGLEYMDMLSKGSEKTEFAASTNGREFTDENLHGQDYLYSFELNGDDRRALFSLMNASEEDVRQDFFEGVGAWQEVTAYNAFVRDGGSERPEQSSTFHDIGRVAGTVQYVQKVETSDDSSKLQFTSYGALSTSASVANTLIDFGKGNAITSVGAYGITEALRYSLPDGAAAHKQAQWDAVNFGDNTVRAIVADAAIRSDYRGSGDYQLPDVSSDNVDRDDLRRATLDVEGATYDHYRDALVEGYNDAVYNDATAN